ncbi:hypothetical protein DFH28DRAFT_22157 [Melampsora americana]|nr:hypothetical protein DFH28DRAFT_22157 [Melampsora americana]
MESNTKESIYKISKALNQSSQINFTIRNSLSTSVLSSSDQFESNYIREANQTELSLFQLNENKPAPYQVILDATTHQLNLDHQTTSEKSKQQRETGDVAATRSYLMAMQTLLQIYPMPRLEDHVNALIRQLNTLESSITGLQEQLQLPRPTQLPTKPRVKTKSKPSSRMKETIQRESLEILALTDLRDEQRAKFRQLSEQIAQIETISNSPKKRKTPKKPIPLTSTSTGPHDPFISRTELTRRIIQRAKSPRIHSSSQAAGASDFEDDNHMPNTPTPQNTTHKRLQQSLTKLKSRTPHDSRSQSLQLSDSPKKQNELSMSPSIVPKPELDKYPIDQQADPSHSSEVKTLIETSSSPSKPMTEPPNSSLPESRLAVLLRLTNSFWKSNTLLDSLKIANPELQTLLDKAEGTLDYQQTTEALDNLIKSYLTKVDSTLTPNKLIEAYFYYELFKSFSETDSNSLPAIFHQNDWCVSLELMKTKLVDLCQQHSLSVSINTTVIYLLVGKMVIRIDRRANPILICVC